MQMMTKWAEKKAGEEEEEEESDWTTVEQFAE
jgi:hypothetical protein